MSVRGFAFLGWHGHKPSHLCDDPEWGYDEDGWPLSYEAWLIRHSGLAAKPLPPP